jgi:16S rRNA (guanine966-N2)-methyltransferase
MATKRPGSLRIIGGTHRGRRLVTPRGESTRPPLDRQRETIFNLLGAAVADAVVLDLFSGSGSFGLEALSRGAREVWFVENDRAALEALAANRAALGVESASHVVRADAFRFPAAAPRGPARVDLVFIDPPFRALAGAPGLPALARLAADLTAILAPGGLVVLRLPAGAPALPPPPGWHVHRARVLGASRVHFYRSGEENDGP